MTLSKVMVMNMKAKGNCVIKRGRAKEREHESEKEAVHTGRV